MNGTLPHSYEQSWPYSATATTTHAETNADYELRDRQPKCFQQAGFSFDPRNLEIKTKSIERTLLPLVTQISTLINFKEESIITGNRPKTDRAFRAALKVDCLLRDVLIPTREKVSDNPSQNLLKIGSAVQAAVERFVVVGETIADENPDVQPEMYDACHEARIAGSSIASVHNSIAEQDATTTSLSKTQIIKAARQLLSSVTRVLLLADRVMVRHILRAEDKIAYSLSKLENTVNFTEFVSIFTEFGSQMVDLAHRSGDRQSDLKSEKRAAQTAIARSNLERLTMLLLTSSKTVLRHPDDFAARKCRDGVFHQIRLALQLIALCVTDGVLPLDLGRYGSTETLEVAEGPLDVGNQLTASVAIKQLTEMLEMVRMMNGIGIGVQERLVSSLDVLCEMTQDFTDSAYTPHQQREKILDFLEECRFEMSALIQPRQELSEHLRNEGIEASVEKLDKRLKDLRAQLQMVALERVAVVLRTNEDHTILSSIKTCSVAGDIDGVEKFLQKFKEHTEQLQEVCRLLHHISLTDALHVYSGHTERNLRCLAPLALLAGRTLCIHPSSRIARENLEVFCDSWAANRHGTTQKPTKPVTLGVEDQHKIAKAGLEMKLLTAEVEAEAEKWDEYAENDIVKRAKAMSSMSYNMYLFTKGDGPLKTTHDLFTQAEFFAEQANKMYRTVLEFAYEVPGSPEKSDLQVILERIPLHCQELQIFVKDPTVGKTATFNKVDSVISETKALMNEIAKLVTACFVCATKFEIEFRGTSSISRPNLIRDASSDYVGGVQRSSRESSLWRRTPSVRRRTTASPQVNISNLTSSPAENV